MFIAKARDGHCLWKNEIFFSPTKYVFTIALHLIITMLKLYQESFLVNPL